MISQVSACLLETCCQSFPNPLEIIFESCIEKGQLSNKLRKGTVGSIHNKCDKQVPRNYCPVSLFPICRKILKV